jgi:hypothetical protein
MLDLFDTGGDPLKVRLKHVIYVPGLTQGLYSISQFAKSNNTAEIVRNIIYLKFDDHTVTCPLFSAAILASNTTTAKKNQVPSSRNKVGDLVYIPLETLHHRSDHIYKCHCYASP